MSWAPLSTSAEDMIIGDLDSNGHDEVIINFGETYGLWAQMNNSHWIKLHSQSPKSMVSGNIDGLLSSLSLSETIGSLLPPALRPSRR